MALWLLFAGCDAELDRMIHQRRPRPFGEWRSFADGRAMRPPPVGTVPSSGVPPRGAPPVTFALVHRGRDRFDIFCAPCHGALGDGRSKVAAAMTLRRPPSLLGDIDRERAYRAASLGYGLMPSYAGSLDERDRWAVATYVEALKLASGAPLGSLPAPLRRAAEEALR
jgi:mono/diheme cytochrome c family protein